MDITAGSINRRAVDIIGLTKLFFAVSSSPPGRIKFCIGRYCEKGPAFLPGLSQWSGQNR
jgi:hypothetical protein